MCSSWWHIYNFLSQCWKHLFDIHSAKRNRKKSEHLELKAGSTFFGSNERSIVNFWSYGSQLHYIQEEVLIIPL